MAPGIAARSPARSRRAPAETGLTGRLGGSAGEALRRALSRLVRLLGAHRRLRIAAICSLAALPLMAGGYLLLRRSPLVAVEHVRISGVHGRQARAIERALTDAARGMGTLSVSNGSLRAAVAQFPVVVAIRTIPHFPHSLRILVSEQQPVAALTVAGVKTAVSGSGVVLGPALLSSRLPTVADDLAPVAGTHLRNPLVLAALKLFGAAPPALDHLAEKAFIGPRGLTVVMRNGLLVYFGDADRPNAKWLSLAAVLADSRSAGASYVDVRLPERPAAGFPDGAAHTETTGTGTGQSGGESAVSALAAGLAADNPNPTTPSGEPEETNSQTQASGSAAAGSTGETSTQPATESEPQQPSG